MKYLPTAHGLSFLRDLVSQILTAFVTCNFHLYLFSSVILSKVSVVSPLFSAPFCLASQLLQSLTTCPKYAKVQRKKASCESWIHTMNSSVWNLGFSSLDCLGNALMSSNRFFLLGYFIQSFLGNFICYKLIKGTIC